MEGISDSLAKVERRLSSQLEKRENVLKGSRDVIASCSRAIISVHTRKLKEAEEELARAKQLLARLRKGNHTVARYLVSPETEFVEASAVLALATGRRVPSIEALGASPESYLLGLLDTVGEMKRLVLDSVMRGKYEDAQRYFQVMEEIYSACSPLAVYDHVANGARRKIDVARMLVEDIRGLMTEESRRQSIGASMSRLERRLEAKRKR